MPSDVDILLHEAVEQKLIQVEKKVDCVDVLYVICVDEKLDVVEDVECVRVDCVECVDEWLRVCR